MLAPPSITLLCRGHAPLDANALRRAMRRRLGRIVTTAATSNPRGSWLAPDGRGSGDGIAWTIRHVDAPVELDERALSNVDDVEVLATLRAHTAHVIVAAATNPSEPAERARCYAELARIAFLAWSDDVVGIGCAENGLFFEASEAIRYGLLGDDPLAALSPSVPTRLVVLLRAPFVADKDLLEAACQREFGNAFETSAVAVVGSHAAVSHDGLVVTMSPRDPLEFDPNAEGDLRRKQALAAHRAVLHLEVRGPAGGEYEQNRSRLLARIVAASWTDDCLGLVWNEDTKIVPADSSLLTRLRDKDPVAASKQAANPAVVGVETKDEEMEAAISKARQEFDRASAFFRGGGAIHVKFPFATRAGSEEHIWVSVDAIEGDEVRGTLGNEPVDVEGMQIGIRVVRKVAELSDWLYQKDGALVGGYSIELLDRRQKASERRGGDKK